MITATSTDARTVISFKTTVDLLRRAVLSVAPFAHTSAYKEIPILRGVRIIVAEGRVHFAATDRYRLGEATLDLPTPKPADDDVLVTVVVNGTVIVDAAALVKTIKRLSRAQKYEANPVALSVDVDGTLTITEYDRFKGTNNQHVMGGATPDGEFPKIEVLWPDPADLEAPATRWGLNPQFLAEMATAAEQVVVRNTPVTVHAPKPGRPILMTAERDYLSWRAILMPARLREE